MNSTWWKEAVVYQIYPKSFYDSNNDGIGDLKGITVKLPYLAELGIDAIWICPFYKSPMHDNGYDISDYYDINPIFGTIQDMDELLKKAEEYNIKVLIDMVLNHTSDQHKWFQEALRDPSSPYRDYYIFKEADEMPSNGRSIFGGPVWEKTEDGSYYFHTFDKTQPDLNWENPKMRQEIYDMMNYWLDKGISGFRMDAITFIKKDQKFPSFEPNQEDGLSDISATCMNQQGIDELLQELKNETYGKKNAVTVAEAPGVPYDRLQSFIGEAGHFSMIFDFSYTDIDLLPGGTWYQKREWTIMELKKALFLSQKSVQEVGWGALYLENHDQPRSINKYFKEDALNSNYEFYMGSVLATMYFLLRGTPFIYQGEEIGMLNCDFDSIDEYDDVNTLDQYKRAINAGYTKEEAMEFVFERSRDNSRTPMQWENDTYAGFSGQTPWLKVNPNYTKLNVASQIKEENSLFHYYQKLIRLRKESEYKNTFIYGNIEAILTEYENIVAYSRRLDENEVVIITNLSKEIYEIPMKYKKCILANYGEVKESEKEQYIMIRPYEAVVLVKN